MKSCIDAAIMIKRLLIIKGWCFSDRSRTIKIDIITRNKIYKDVDYNQQNSDDVIAVYGSNAEKSRFSLSYILDHNELAKDIKIKFYNEFEEVEIYDFLDKSNTGFQRIAQILCEVNIDGVGLEIGPLDKPILPKKLGLNVQIMDHMSKASLQKKYQDDSNVSINDIEEIDFIWDGRRYSDIIEKTNYYDYIIASHLIEHTTDLIGFLQECEEILNENGVLSLAIPDKRYCFDYFRPVTSLSSIIDCHITGNKTHSPGVVAEQFLYAVMNRGDIGCAENPDKEITLYHSIENVKKYMQDVITNNTFYDVHQWVFTPNSFRLLLRDLQDLGFTNLREVAFHNTVGNEFFITLAKNTKKPEDISRRQLLVEACNDNYSNEAFLSKLKNTVFPKESSRRKIAKKLYKAIIKKMIVT